MSMPFWHAGSDGDEASDEQPREVLRIGLAESSVKLAVGNSLKVAVLTAECSVHQDRQGDSARVAAHVRTPVARFGVLCQWLADLDDR
jgi:hypothetical protein